MVYKRRKKKVTTTKKTKKSEPKEKLIFNKDKWIIGSAQIKKYKESLNIKVCPVTKLPFGTGMDVDCLDHAHDPLSPRIRGILSSRVNLFYGRVELYYHKLLKKTGIPLVTILENLVEYIKESENHALLFHGAIIDAERRRVSRWKKETIYNKLMDKGLTLLDISEYNQGQLVHLYLQDFIFDIEKE